MNMLQYMYYYNGAGIGAADFNNDGQIDLFFASNEGQNKMYLNEGGMHFKEVTNQAKIPNDSGWSTGISVVDINNDGLMDIYVCRVGKFKTLKGKNQLLVCQGIVNNIPVYKDEAEKYGLDFSGFSTQAVFFDYDHDGDLDMFLLNHSVNHENNYLPRNLFLNTYDTLRGSKMFENINGHFKDVTKQSGINSSRIGYGLGVCVSDLNNDGWPDLYIGNDFHENDYLYINQGNKTFKDELSKQVMHTSQFSMGVDIADINNDGFSDIFSNDMLPNNAQMLKQSLGEDDYQTLLEKTGRYGYQFQYARNNLQLNRRNGMFSETAFYSGVYATDWSWSALWFDFDNDGKKDLFISNGIPKRLNDIDYVNFLSNEDMMQKVQTKQLLKEDWQAINKFPEIKLPNYFFINKGNAKFENQSQNVNNNLPTFSNGAVYADFDNDGYLDIAVNNISDQAIIYQNLQHDTLNKYFNLTLHGDEKNIDAIGAKVYIFSEQQIIATEKTNVHGFLSSFSLPMHISVGKNKIDSIFLVWPDNTFTKLNPNINEIKREQVYQKKLPKFNYHWVNDFIHFSAKKFLDITTQTNLNYTHEENNFNEFNREHLLPKMHSSEGPALAVADINNDGLADIFIGSSKWKQSAIYFQKKEGTFYKSNQPELIADSTFEDVDAVFADVNKDGFNDLIIASGGNEFYANERWNEPRLYLNDGKGNMKLSSNAFSNIHVTQSCIKVLDFNEDGFPDLFIGGRCVAYAYGKTPNSYLLKNDGHGHFIDVTDELAPGLKLTGLVTNAVICDINQDKHQDLIITKEWGGIEAYIFKGGKFEKKIITDKLGWWNFILPIDINKDGHIDFVAGNQGQNCRLQPTEKFPINMYYADFLNNGTYQELTTYFVDEKEICLATLPELQKEFPFLKKKYLYASDFSKASITEIFGTSVLNSAKKFSANYFSSAVFINDGKDNFTLSPLPWQAQLSCLRDAVEFDANADGYPDILTGGNFYEQNTQLNRNDADFGTVLINDKHGNFTAETINGIVIKNQFRHILPIYILGKASFVITRNNDSALIIQ